MELVYKRVSSASTATENAHAIPVKPGTYTLLLSQGGAVQATKQKQVPQQPTKAQDHLSRYPTGGAVGERILLTSAFPRVLAQHNYA